MVSNEQSTNPTDGLWSRLRLIEGQSLGDRAAAYATMHDELSKRLDGSTRADARERL